MGEVSRHEDPGHADHQQHQAHQHPQEHLQEPGWTRETLEDNDGRQKKKSQVFCRTHLNSRGRHRLPAAESSAVTITYQTAAAPMA